MQRARARLPLFVFVLLLLLLLIMLGFACACISDHPVQAMERALAAIPSAAPVIELWTLSLLAFVAVTGIAKQRRTPERASPSMLQCFLF